MGKRKGNMPKSLLKPRDCNDHRFLPFWHCHQNPIFLLCKMRRSSRFFFEQEQTLAGLPFLIWELSGGCVQEMVVVSDCRRSFVQ